MTRRYRLIHVLGVLALLCALSESLLGPSAPISALAQEGNAQSQEANQQAQESPEAADLDRGRPNEYPVTVTLDDQQYLFDRLVPLRRQDLTRVGQEQSTQYFARDEQGPFDQLYVSVPNRSEAELARYLPTRIDNPDEACPAEDGDLGTINAGDTTYAFAGPEPDLTTDQLQEVGDAGGQTIYALGEQPFDELFLSDDQDLQRFIAVDEDGVPDVLTGDIPFGTQTLNFSANANEEIDPTTLSKIGCAGPFPLLAPQDETVGSLTEVYANVGGQYLRFTVTGGAPAPEDADEEEADQQAATEETTAAADETATAAPDDDEATPEEEETVEATAPIETVAPDEETTPATDLSVQPGGAPDEGDGGQPEGLPRELIVGDVRYLFDRLVTLERQDLVRVAQDGPFIVYARGEQPPFDRIYVSVPPRDEGELARYLPEVLDSPDNPCPAETQSLGRVTAGDAAYAFADVETDITQDDLQQVGQAQERTIFAQGEQPFTELFLTDANGLLRFIIVDAEGRPAPLQDSLLFGGQLFTFASDVTDQTDIATLTRVGCTTAFPVFADAEQEDGSYTQLYVQAGGRLLLFTAEGAAAPATEEPTATATTTAVPATETPTATAVPATETPTTTAVPATETPTATATTAPPTNTPVPATNTPVPPTQAPPATQVPATQAAAPTQVPQQATQAVAPTATPRPQGPAFIPTRPPQAPPPAAATVVPARCTGDVGPLLSNGLPERLPRRIQLGGVTYTFARVEDATAVGEPTRLGCVGPFEVVTTNLSPQAEVLFLRVFGAQSQVTYYRFEAIRTFNVTLQVTGNPRVISTEDQSYALQRTLVQSVYSSVSVILYVEQADDPAPAILYARQGKDDPTIARYEPEGEIREASAELREAAEAVGINPDLTLNGRRYILIEIYEPVGATGNGFITFYGIGDAETQEFVIGYDPRRLDLLVYVPR